MCMCMCVYFDVFVCACACLTLSYVCIGDAHRCMLVARIYVCLRAWPNRRNCCVYVYTCMCVCVFETLACSVLCVFYVWWCRRAHVLCVCARACIVTHQTKYDKNLLSFAHLPNPSRATSASARDSTTEGNPPPCSPPKYQKTVRGNQRWHGEP